jgi:hypothetical protein
MFEEDFAWQQEIFHVKAMEISRLSGIGMHDVRGITNAPDKKPFRISCFSQVMESKGG